MKIKTKVLVSFLKKFRMSGAQEIKEALFRFEADGLKIDANSPAKLTRAMSWLKLAMFSDYEEFGNVGLNDLENVVKVLERFGEEITIKKEGNAFTVKSGNKEVTVPLVAEDYLDTDTKEPPLEFTETFSISAKQLNEIFKDVKMNADSSLSITTEEKKVIFTNTGKYKFKTVVEAPTCKGGVTVNFGEPFLEALTKLDGLLEISVGNDYPAKVMEKLDNSVITFIIAPIVSEE